MELGVGTYGLGFLAGVLSTLSPCVLPLVPILLGSATNVHPRAPFALAGGLAISYAILGTLIAWAGTALNIDGAIFRNTGAVMLGLLGIVLMSSSFQERFAVATSGLGNAGSTLIDRIQPTGLRGQFIIGLVLGVVWSPCVGPTLGAALVLAGRGSHLLEVAFLMSIFGIGAAMPVVLLATVSRSGMAKMRGRLLSAGKVGKSVMGGFMLVVAMLILSGADKSIEAWLVNYSPEWLTALTTRF